jgi:hypothetical protein
MERSYRPGPPPTGVTPVTVPGDLVLVRRPGLVTWVGAVTAFPGGFEFTLMTLFDVRQVEPPAGLALDVPQRSQETWLAVRFCDGRYRAADLNANTPRDQPEGPHLQMQDGEANWTEGWDISRWWATPLPPAGPVELAIHLNGAAHPSGVGYLDGTALVEAASKARALWPERPPR